MEGIRFFWRRFGAPVVALAMVLPLVMSAGGPATAASPSCAAPPAGAPSAPPPIGGFNAIAPVRLLDTRPTGLLAAGCVVAVDVSSVAPAQAAGIALNVTTTDARARGFVTAFPCGGPMPSTSNLNPRITDPTPNLVVVPLDSTRKVCLFTYAATNLLVDATGWFGGTGALFHEQAPQRIVDTRTAPRPDGGTGKLAAGSVLTIPMAGVSVPAGATAVAVNLTITEPDGPGYATAFPCGAPAPLTSQVNFLPGENRSNQAMVGLGNGALCVFVFASTHLVVDLAGWFGTADGGVPLQPILGARLLDTRNGTGGPTGAFAPGEMRVLDPSASGAVPAGAHDLLLNVVATQAAAPGYLSVFPCAGGVPATSSVNYAPGAESTNLVTVPIDNDGKVCIFSFERTHVVIDLLGAMGAPGNVRSLTVTGLALDPTFRPDVHDYTLACRGPANPVSYAAAAMPGTTLTVDGTAAGGTASGDVTLAENQALVVTAGTDQYWVRCLPHDFPPLTVSKTGPVAPGYYLMENGVAGGARFVMILDTNGVPVWYRRVSPSIDFKQLPDGNLAYMPFVRANFNIDPAQRYIETTLDGTVVRTIGTAPADGLDPVTDYHDLFPLTNGNFITVSYRVRPGSVTVPADYPPCGNGHTVIDGILQEVTPAGAVVWTWNSADHIDLSESVPVCDVPAISGASATNAYDLMHINSVDEDPASGDLVVSARYTNSILRISRSAAGTVLWKIGGYTAANHDGAVHFDVVGDPDGSFNLAHDVRWLPANGHITLFDNRANPNVPGVMRAAEYAIDAGTHTATFVWQRPIDGPCSTPTCKSFGLGSVRRQPDGNTVIAWGGESSPAFTEVDPAGNALLQVSLPVANLTYRVVKVPLTAFSLDQLHNTVSG